MAQVSKTRAIGRLQTLVDEASDLDSYGHNSQKFRKWAEGVYSAFIHIFGENSYEFSRLPQNHSITPNGMKDYFDSMFSALDSNLENIKYFWEEDKNSTHNESQIKHLAFNFTESGHNHSNNKVFVVHGRDDTARETVARFLEKLGLEPIILHEQVSMGRTIIEKFEDHADVAFAVVLLTSDDVGGFNDGQPELKPRARQNVILELGFFLGRLGRNRVCPLVRGDVETPSDYDGVVYVPLDEAGAWQMKLIQELKAVDFYIDANKVI